MLRSRGSRGRCRARWWGRGGRAHGVMVCGVAQKQKSRMSTRNDTAPKSSEIRFFPIFTRSREARSTPAEWESS